MLKGLLGLLGCTFLLACTSVHAQSGQQATREVSTPLKNGDLSLGSGASQLSMHYAVVPLAVKGETSFYARFSRRVAVKNVITDAAGNIIKTWASGPAEQCFTNISQDVFKNTATGTVYTWKITTTESPEPANITFTAQDALGR